MAKSTSRTAPPRDINQASERIKVYIRMLRRKSGATAEEMRVAAGGITPHNSWSLGEMAKMYGFECYFAKTPQHGNRMTYQFVRPGEPTTAFETNVVSDPSGQIHEVDQTPSRTRKTKEAA